MTQGTSCGRTRGARTTQAQDCRRRKRRSRYLTRGGRPRRSIWWRAWLAKLLASEEPAPPAPPAAPQPISSHLDQGANTLTITFDAPIDPTSTLVPTQLRYGNGTEMYLGSGTVVYSGLTVRVSILTPVSLPFGSGAWLFGGAGELRGANGLVVQPFGPV